MVLSLTRIRVKCLLKVGPLAHSASLLMISRRRSMGVECHWRVRESDLMGGNMWDCESQSQMKLDGDC